MTYSDLIAYKRLLYHSSSVPAIDLKYGRKVYSQNDEDGIIEKLCEDLGCSRGSNFLEIGASDGLENNTHFLLEQGWTGTWVEADSHKSDFARYLFNAYVQSHSLAIRSEFITPSSESTFVDLYPNRGELDLLSLDIDGPDHIVLSSLLKSWTSNNLPLPSIIVCEYNGKFGPFVRCEARTDKLASSLSPLLYKDHMRGVGSSLRMFIDLLRPTHTLVSCNITGVNAFFVKNDLISSLKFPIPSIDDIYRPLENRFWQEKCFARQSGFEPCVVAQFAKLNQKKH
jgi:hypothetical protein